MVSAPPQSAPHMVLASSPHIGLAPSPHVPSLPITWSPHPQHSPHTLSVLCETETESGLPATVTDSYFPHAEPISPAAPETPNHRSEDDRISPGPSWPSQWMQTIASSPPQFASLPPLQRFPFSALSINVGSASNSARSSPIPQIHLSMTSSPGSAVLPRQQEPIPLLSEHYEPLSDDEEIESK